MVFSVLLLAPKLWVLHTLLFCPGKGVEYQRSKWMGWDRMRWDRVGCGGLEWDGMDWNGMEWNRMGWDGVGWGELDWNGVGWWSAVGLDGMG